MRPAAPNHAHDRYGSGGLRLTLYSWRPALRDLGLLAIFPLVLAFIDDNWAFTSSQTGLVDPWLYVARFLHPRSQALAFPLGYYGDRLSYIVPGWLWYQALGPLAGNYAFKLLDIYMAIGGLYFLVTALLTRRAALLCCALISVHPFFLMCFGWDYVDGAGVSFYTLSLLCCVLAAKSPKYHLRLFLAGALFVSLITTHFLWLNIAWTIPLGFLLVNRSASKHPLGRSLVMFCAGCLAAFMFYSATYWLITERWFYLANTLRHTLGSYGDTKDLNKPLSVWILDASWLMHFSYILPASTIVLWRRRRAAGIVTSLALFVISYVTIWVWQLLGFPFAITTFYVCFVFPVYGIGLAAVMAGELDELSERKYRWLVAAALLAGGGLVLANPWIARLHHWAADYAAAHSTWLPLWKYKVPLAFLAALAGSVPLCLGDRWRRASTPMLVGGFVFLFGAQLFLYRGPGQHAPGNGAYMRGWFAEPSAYTNKEGFLALVEADAWIHRMKPDRRLFLWYNKGDPQPWLMRGLASFYDYYYSALNERLPVLSPADVERLPERLNVAVVASRTGDLSRARQVLEAKGLSIWTQTTVQRGKVTLHLGFAKADLKAVPGVLHLTDFAPEKPATVAATGDRTVRVVSVPKQWSRAATLPLPDPGIGGSFWIHLVVRVTRGTGGFGVLNAAGSAFARRVFVETSTREQDVVIEVHPAEAHMLIVENSTPGEIRAELEILSVELMAKPGTPMWSRLQARVPAPAGQR